MELGGHELGRRRPALAEDRHHLVRLLGAPIAIEAQQLGRLIHPPEDRSREHGRPYGMKAELELGDDSEVSPAAAHPVEEVRVLRFARLYEHATGGDQVNGEKLVDRQPMLAMEPSDPATER